MTDVTGRITGFKSMDNNFYNGPVILCGWLYNKRFDEKDKERYKQDCIKITATKIVINR